MVLGSALIHVLIPNVKAPIDPPFSSATCQVGSDSEEIPRVAPYCRISLALDSGVNQYSDRQAGSPVGSPHPAPPRARERMVGTAPILRK